MRNPFRYFNSSPEVIRLVVMMYIRYPLSLRQVEDLLFERGIDICHETVCGSGGTGSVRCSQRRSGRSGRVHHRSYSQWRWHLDEVFVRINGETHYLWRAVDHEGEVLEVFVHKTPGSQGCAEVSQTNDEALRPAVVDGDRPTSILRCSDEELLEILERQECGRWLNNRAENSHQPFRRREGA